MSLLQTQRRIAAALMAPPSPSGRLRRTPASRAAAALIQPNTLLTSYERLEIYSRSYWARLIGSFADDFPGLRAVLGARAFSRLTQAYLAACPSRSFTLRNLGSRLESWLRSNPSFAAPHYALARDMVRLEWAHIEAFDGLALPPLSPSDLASLDSSSTLTLQPYISLLDLSFPVDELRLRAAENDSACANSPRRRPRRPGPQRVFLAVHRLEDSVFYRRLAPEEFRLLIALRRGRPLADALHRAFLGSRIPHSERPSHISSWFSTFARFGWLAPGSPKQ